MRRLEAVQAVDPPRMDEVEIPMPAEIDRRYWKPLRCEHGSCGSHTHGARDPARHCERSRVRRACQSLSLHDGSRTFRSPHDSECRVHHSTREREVPPTLLRETCRNERVLLSDSDDLHASLRVRNLPLCQLRLCGSGRNPPVAGFRTVLPDAVRLHGCGCTGAPRLLGSSRRAQPRSNRPDNL